MTPKIKIGLVGLNFGRTIIDQLSSPAASPFYQLTALCDMDQVRLEKARPDDSVALYRDLDELLQDKNVEAVGLFTGPGGRAELLRKIVRSGRDVITTKPLELNAEAMLSTLREASQLGRIVHCNSPSPVAAATVSVIENWVQEHRLGRPIGARAEIWASYRETVDGSWYDDPIRCPAAPIYRLGIYLINDLVRLWGKVETIQLLQSRIFTGRPTPDNAQVGLLFKNQAVANIYASFCIGDGDQFRNGMVLNYENGTIYQNTGPAWSTDDPHNSVLVLVKGAPSRPEIIARKRVTTYSGDYQWENFTRAVRGEQFPGGLTPEEMIESIVIMEEIAKLGLPAALPVS